MFRPSARQLLDGWDAYRSESMPMRAAALAALATGVPLRTAVRWPIAQRDRALFDLRAQLFGDDLEGVTNCPSCAERLELRLSIGAIRPAATPSRAARWRLVRLGRARVQWRLPDTEDLIAAGEAATTAEMRASLLARCIRSDDPGLREQVAARLPAEPTDVHFDLSCPACAHRWQSPFDIAAFVWREVDDWAQRTLEEIHVIAASYGWSENEILGLSVRRREAYVGMIR